jgi:hypothetical protein
MINISDFCGGSYLRHATALMNGTDAFEEILLYT